MKIAYKKVLSLFALLLTPLLVFAQGKVQMDNVMMSNGKIYVVVAVLVIIFIGIIIFLISLDKKMNRLEKKSE